MGLTFGVDLALAGALGSGLTVGVGVVREWLRDRAAASLGERGLDVEIEKQSHGMLLDILRLAREEMAQLRTEAAQLRPLITHAAHLDEALDHLHALLNADTPEEFKAAQRRGRAFLKRMRPDPGDRRNEVQTEISAARILNDAKAGKL